MWIGFVRSFWIAGSKKEYTLNQFYLDDGAFDILLLSRGFTWLDTGKMDSLVKAADFIQTMSRRQGITISAPEEIGYINLLD